MPCVWKRLLLVLVELGAGDTAPPTGLRDVTQSLSQLQHREPSLSQFLFRFHRISLLHATKIAPLYLLRKKIKSTLQPYSCSHYFCCPNPLLKLTITSYILIEHIIVV